MEMALWAKSLVCVSAGAVSNVPPMELAMLAAESRRGWAVLVMLGLWNEDAFRGFEGLGLGIFGDEGDVGDLTLSDDRRRDEADIIEQRRRKRDEESGESYVPGQKRSALGHDACAH